MAAVALRAITSLVLVVFLMTGDAGGRCHDLLGHRCGMAAVTGDSLMAAVELELCPSVVIEIPNLPIAGIVAFLAG